MASVDFKKNGLSEGAAMVAHMTRHDGKEDVDYRNKYVDKSWSELNYTIGGDYMTTAQVMRKLKTRIEQIDREIPPKRIKKDRVLVMTFSIPVPPGLSPLKEARFFEIAYDELAKCCGGRQNLSPGYVHRDEVHSYRDAVTGEMRTSRAHMHVAGIPFTREKGVNGKAFETKARMIQLNKAIDERCRRELSVPFMTGDRALTGRSVEELQAASESKTRRQERARLTAERQQLRADVAKLKSSCDALSAAQERSEAAMARAQAAETAAFQRASQALTKARNAEERAEWAQTLADVAEKRFVQLDERSSKAAEEVEALENQLAALRTEKNNMTHELSGIREQLERARAEKAAKEASAHARMEQLKRDMGLR